MRKVVVVDDNKMFLKAVKEFIECKTDFVCTEFSNPEDALRHVLKEKDIYAVVTDYEMPEMSGMTLAQKIIETKIIVMSGHDTNYLKKKAIKAGIDENKIRLLCKSDLINIVVMLNS